MSCIRFIHAADLHLDTAFPGLARSASPELAAKLKDATFTAFSRLVELAEREKVDFVILAGDVYNQEDLSLRAQIAVRNSCERLGARGIRVFLAHGNHDPLASRLNALEWPANVTVFGPQVESFPFFRQDSPTPEPLAIIHGISYANAKEPRNLAALFQRDSAVCPQIGVLHTSLSTVDGEYLYAPSSLDDLAASGLDYWALGHIHEYGVSCQDPLAIYPGAAQGLHIGETGPHGCVLVQMESGGASKAGRPEVRIEHQFYPLAPVAWQALNINLEECHAEDEDQSGGTGQSVSGNAQAVCQFGAELTTLSGLEKVIRQKMQSVMTWSGCEVLILRICLSGRTPLDAELRRFAVQEELIDILQEDVGPGQLQIKIKDLQVQTKAVFERSDAVLREDLLGEVLRRADLWRADEKTLQTRSSKALSDLYGRSRWRKALPELSGPELQTLLDEAELVCANFLENN